MAAAAPRPLIDRTLTVLGLFVIAASAALVLTFDSLSERQRPWVYSLWVAASTAGFLWFARLFVNKEWAS